MRTPAILYRKKRWRSVSDNSERPVDEKCPNPSSWSCKSLPLLINHIIDGGRSLIIATGVSFKKLVDI